MRTISDWKLALISELTNEGTTGDLRGTVKRQEEKLRAFFVALIERACANLSARGPFTVNIPPSTSDTLEIQIELWEAGAPRRKVDVDSPSAFRFQKVTFIYPEYFSASMSLIEEAIPELIKCASKLVFDRLAAAAEPRYADIAQLLDETSRERCGAALKEVPLLFVSSDGNECQYLSTAQINERFMAGVTRNPLNFNMHPCEAFENIFCSRIHPSKSFTSFHDQDTPGSAFYCDLGKTPYDDEPGITKTEWVVNGGAHLTGYQISRNNDKFLTAYLPSRFFKDLEPVLEELLPLWTSKFERLLNSSTYTIQIEKSASRSGNHLNPAPSPTQVLKINVNGHGNNVYNIMQCQSANEGFNFSVPSQKNFIVDKSTSQTGVLQPQNSNRLLKGAFSWLGYAAKEIGIAVAKGGMGDPS